MSLTSDRELIIPDYHNNKLLIFGEDGLFQKAIGSEGQGPGEFELISGLYVKEDILYVSDIAQQRISKFNIGSQELLEIISIEGFFYDFLVDDDYIATYSIDDTDKEMIRIHSLEGEKLSKGFKFEDDAHRIFLNRFNLGSITPAPEGDTFFVLYPGSYGIYELNTEMEVINALQTYDYNQYRQKPPSFPGDLNPYEWEEEHIEYAQSFNMNARHFLVEPDIHIIMYFEFRQQEHAPMWLNIYRNDGSVIAEGVEVPKGHQVVATKNDCIFLRTALDYPEDIPRIEEYKIDK